MKRTLIALALGTVVALAISFFWWVSMPISLEFVRGGGMAGDPLPFMVDLSRKDGNTVSEPLPQHNGIYQIPVGRNLEWNVRVGDPESLDSSIFRTLNLSGYYLLFAVTLSDGTTELFEGGRAVPEKDSEGHWVHLSSDVSRGEAALFVLASRTPFDMEELRRGIEERRVKDSPVNRITNYLSSQRGGFLLFQLKVTD